MVTAKHITEVTHVSKLWRGSMVPSAASESTCFKPQEVHLHIVPASKYQTKEHEVWITPECFSEIMQNCSNHHRAPAAGKHLETSFKVLWNIKKGPEWDFLELMNIYYNTFLKTIKKLSTIEIGNRFLWVSHIFAFCKLQLKTYNQNIVKCQKKAEERAADIWTFS